MNRALTGLLTLTCWILGATMSMAADVEGIRSYRGPDHTRLVLDLSEGTKHTMFTLDNPERIVVDIKDTRLASSLDGLDLDDTPVKQIRSAARNGTDLRVVFDMNASVNPHSFALEPNQQYGNRLVIDLYDKKGEGDAGGTGETGNTERSEAVANIDNADAADAETTDIATTDNPAAVADGTTNASAPETREPRSTLSANDLDDRKNDIVVAISAGHGGEDPGAIGVNGLQEKQVVLAIASQIKNILGRTPGYRAVMVRESDYYVNLRQRTRLAHEYDADFFVAIHADAFTHSRARGATVYALSQSGATSEHAQRLADKENSADLIGGVGSVSLKDKDEMLASVLLDLSMTASISSSLEAGEKVIAAMNRVAYMRRTHVEQAAFVVLKSPDIPSLLIETGYVTNPHDAANLDSTSYRKRLANAIVDGITDYFWEAPPRGTLISWQKQNGIAPQQHYTVVSGDSLSLIAQRFDVSLQTLRDTNQLNSDTIQIGQTIRIPSI